MESAAKSQLILILLFILTNFLFTVIGFANHLIPSNKNNLHSNSIKLLTSSNSSPLSALDDFSTIQRYFIGKYSNVEQAMNDLANNQPTAKLGGHELITGYFCYHNKEENCIISSYSLGENNESNPYRYRLYKFYISSDTKFQPYCALMKLYKPSQTTLNKLKQNNFNPLSYIPLLNECEEIVGCDVGWERVVDKTNEIMFRGVLVNGECKVCSEKDPTMKLLVRDEIYLSKLCLSINDRVYTESGDLIIGNIHNMPYLLNKII
eukprot:gene11801-15791_t